MHFHKHLIEARLGKLAEAGRTGALRVPGDGGGAVYLRHGGIVFAQSQRTPGPAGRAAGDPAPGPAAAGEAASAGFPARLARDVAVWEATLDAVLDLLSRDVRHVRFRPDETPPTAAAAGSAVASVLGETARRQAVLRQLSPLLTMDSPVARNLRLDSRGVRVSSLQWALLIRAKQGSTPRTLALDLGHGVFATTLRVFRLMELGLLCPARPSANSEAISEAASGGPAGQLPGVSFLRAVVG